MRLFRSETGKLCPAGQIWSTTCCTASKLRMVFTLLNDWGKKKFVTWKLYEIWISLSIKFYWNLKTNPLYERYVFPISAVNLDVWCCSFDFQHLVISLLSLVSFNLLSGVKLMFDYLSKVMTNLDSILKTETLLCQQRSI